MSASWKNKRIKVGDRVMDKSIGHAGTVERLIPSAVFPAWICAYVVRYDQAPPMEYNMGSTEGLVFAKHINKIKA